MRRQAAGITAAIAATAWLTHDLGPSRWNVHVVLVAAPTAVLTLGVVNLVRLTVPRGSLAGPALLVGIGGVGLALATHTLAVRRLADVGLAAIIVMEVYAVLTKSTSDPRVETGVRHYAAWFWVRRPIRPVGPAPAVAVVRALFGSLTLDLSDLEKPRDDDEGVVLDATVIFGRVTLVTGTAWRVEPGRLDLTYTIHFDDSLAASGTSPSRPIVLNVQGCYSALGIKEQP
jgi:hypothetical protein